MALRSDAWQRLLEGEPEGTEPLWELFHENSKTSRVDAGVPPALVAARMEEMWESLPYVQYPKVELPTTVAEPSVSVADAIRARASASGLKPVPLGLDRLAAILELSYGVTRGPAAGLFPRARRASPSAGALYPLELYVHSAHLEGQRPGIYHYNPGGRHLRLIVEGDHSRQLGGCLVQPGLAREASMVIFVTALFERATFKYGERGYRFALLEAGHVVQNVNLVATALGLGVLDIGGFFDREVDDLLGVDGLTHSTVYMVAVGGRADPSPAPV